MESEHPVTTFMERDTTLDRKSSSSSSSSSSSGFLLKDFQVDLSVLNRSATGSSDHLDLHENVRLPSEENGEDILSHSPKSEESYLGSSPGLKESPPAQIMERTGNSNSYRIPSKVFERKSQTPLEWSVASNESLFSLHAGNSSFSKDSVFFMGRSGELYKSGDLTNFSGIVPIPYMVPDAEKNTTVSEGGLGVTETAAETMEEVLKESGKDHSRDKTPSNDGTRLTTSLSQCSEGSVASTQSFAFPILTKETGKSISPKVEEPQQQQQPQPEGPQETPPETQAKWFPCCSCCPFCC